MSGSSLNLLKPIKYRSVFRYKTGDGLIQKYFCHLIDAALNYKYRHYNGLTVAIEAKDMLNNPVFEFKETDQIPLNPKATVIIHGKQLRELFVTVIFACYLDTLSSFHDFHYKNDQVSLAFPETDTGTDTVIIISKGSVFFEHNNKVAIGIGGKSALTIAIQVKEYFNFADLKEDILKPKPFDLNKLNTAKLKIYDDVILVYIRSFTLINFDELYKAVEDAGLSEKEIILIGTEKKGDEIATHYTIWNLKNKTTEKVPAPTCHLLKTFEEIAKK
jgi:hypothetical protein